MKSKVFASTLLAALTLTLTLTGCKTPTTMDKGPIKAATFSFFRPGPQTEAALAEKRQQIHALIQQAIVNHLQAQGLTQVAQGGEVTVAYLVIVGNNATTSSVNDYFGYSDDATALEDKAHKAYTGSDHPGYFEAGTLVIDILDSHTSKLLRRGNVTRPVLRNPPLDVRQAHIQEAVDAALAGVQVKRP